MAGLVAAAAGVGDLGEHHSGVTAARTAVFWTAADRIWSGGVPDKACLASGRTLPFTEAQAVRSAVYSRRGEVIGEFRATAAQTPAVVAQARSCASEADAATTTYALLTEADRSWGVFRQAFAACMSDHQQAQYMGSMTLWIDERCDW